MKKIVLLVASVIAALQSYANRYIDGIHDNSLILSPSNEIYNHGSHASHRSHTSHSSHYSSMHVISVKKDFAQDVNLSPKEKRNIIHTLAVIHSCADKDINIEKLYISNNNKIIMKGSDMIEYVPAPNEICLYISYSKKDFSKFTFAPSQFFSQLQVLIPLSSKKSNYFLIVGDSFRIEKKEQWMIDFAAKYQ